MLILLNGACLLKPGTSLADHSPPTTALLAAILQSLIVKEYAQQRQQKECFSHKRSYLAVQCMNKFKADVCTPHWSLDIYQTSGVDGTAHIHNCRRTYSCDSQGSHFEYPPVGLYSGASGWYLSSVFSKTKIL